MYDNSPPRPDQETMKRVYPTEWRLLLHLYKVGSTGRLSADDISDVLVGVSTSEATVALKRLKGWGLISLGSNAG